MDDVQARLARCFSAVFPSLIPERVLQASAANLEAWDSVASVTLVAMIEEEFGIELEIGELAELVSFEKMLAHLRKTKVS